MEFQAMEVFTYFIFYLVGGLIVLTLIIPLTWLWFSLREEDTETIGQRLDRAATISPPVQPQPRNRIKIKQVSNEAKSEALQQVKDTIEQIIKFQENIRDQMEVNE